MEASTLRIESSKTAAAVVFSDIEGDQFRISVIAPDHSASYVVDANTDPAGVAHLFAEAARDWRGWDGAKEWESICSDLRLQLTTDRSGHVTLLVHIRQSVMRAIDAWELRAELALESGQLDRIARDAAPAWSTAARDK